MIAHSSHGSILPGASRVVRTMVFQDLVDQFGNIPYSQAGDPVITTPAYDSATTIYKDLVLQIDTAIGAIQASQATADDASDVMFAGNKNLWIQFANTIKLRILLRQVPKVYSPTDPIVTNSIEQCHCQWWISWSRSGCPGESRFHGCNPGPEPVLGRIWISARRKSRAATGRHLLSEL